MGIWQDLDGGAGYVIPVYAQRPPSNSERRVWLLSPKAVVCVETGPTGLPCESTMLYQTAIVVVLIARHPESPAPG
jgi:hypothetical protein